MILLCAARGVILIAALFLFSCSPVKFVSRDSYLLNKVNVDVEDSKISKEEVKTHIRQKANYKILGFAKFYLWLYNLSSKDKTEGWLKRIGEAPVVFDQAMVYASEVRLKRFLSNKGFFRASVHTDVKLKENRRKANVSYKIVPGEQYTIKKAQYHFGDASLRNVFLQDSSETFISSGTPFDFDLLEKHREDIVELYRNEGFYFFNKDDVRYLADSSKMEREIILDLFVGNEREQDSIDVYTPQVLNNFQISVLPGTSPFTSNAPQSRDFSDTVVWDNFTLYQGHQINYRPELFDNLMQMESGSYYKLHDAKNTFEAFNRLRQFRFIDIEFRKPPGLKDTNLLDCSIRLAPLNKQAVSFDLEGTNTSGNLGIAGNLNYKHRNFFKGAEVFQLNFKGAMERQQRVVKDIPEYFNTRELGVEANFTVPGLLGPGRAMPSFHDFLPQTVFTLGYNYQQRPEYTRTIMNVKFGYDWMTTENLQHNWNLVDFNRVNLYQFDPGFIDFIKDLYIKSSFTDHLILAMNYSMIYNTQGKERQRNYSFLRFNAESAGNLLEVFAKAANMKKYESVDSIGLAPVEYYRIFNTRFAQYIKSDVEFRYGYTIDKYNALVARGFLGVGLPYGNFDVLPFEKKYFTGGANGIRAWQVRSLGPGTYRAPSGSYPNQSSDIKIEANLEYRFRLIGFLEGALFFDAGNIWAINKKDNRPGAQFRFDRFYKQLALGTGTGFRFDFDYFIFRFDVGMKLRDPSQMIDNGWIIGHRKFTMDDFNLSFAIGYPF